MEQLAAPGTVLLTESTAQLVEGFFALADVGPRSMKGVSAEIRTFELRGIGPRRTRLDGSVLRGLSRLIGRETELTWLDGILARSIASNGQVVGVIGEAGVGKSRLCLEFIQRCRARGVPVHEVHCPSHGATVPWLAIRELMRGYFGLAPDTSAASIRRTVQQQLRALDARILERTGGSPFFTEEVVTALAASGSLLGERGAYRLATPIETLALPATVQALLTARIDRLGERAKDLLQVAAVIGKQFDEPLLREVSGLGEGHDLDAVLGVLQDEEFFRLVTLSPKPEYAFKHPLVCEVAYLSQLGERRAQVHAAVATALEKLRSGRLGEYASLIAHHWEASGMRFEAARWKRRAALRVANIKVGIRGVRRRPARPPENG